MDKLEPVKSPNIKVFFQKQIIRDLDPKQVSFCNVQQSRNLRSQNLNGQTLLISTDIEFVSYMASGLDL